MRSFLRITVLASVLAILIASTVVHANDPPFFISDAPIDTSTSDPDGSGEDPIIAADVPAARAACKALGEKLTGDQKSATVYYYRVAAKEYYEFYLEKGDTEEDNICDQVAKVTGKEPPGFGVELTPPVIISGLTIIGLSLVSAAWLLRRKPGMGERST